MIVPILSECLRIVEELLRPENSVESASLGAGAQPDQSPALSKALGLAKMLVWYALALVLGLGLARLGA